MIDAFDYKEPACALCDGKSFYYPDKNEPDGRIPIDRIIKKLDELLNRRDTDGAERHLCYWLKEAVLLRDRAGELAIESERIGHFRKTEQKEPALASVARAITLLDELEQKGVSRATILINCATAYKAFGFAKEAVPLYREAEAIYDSLLADADPLRAGLYNNMALALADLGMLDEAERYDLSAIAIMKQTPNGQADAGISYLNLAHLYEKAGRNADIAEAVLAATECLTAPELEGSPYLAYVYTKCAPSFAYFGYPDIADALSALAEEIYAGT